MKKAKLTFDGTTFLTDGTISGSAISSSGTLRSVGDLSTAGDIGIGTHSPIKNFHLQATNPDFIMRESESEFFRSPLGTNDAMMYHFGTNYSSSTATAPHMYDNMSTQRARTFVCDGKKPGIDGEARSNDEFFPSRDG